MSTLLELGRQAHAERAKRHGERVYFDTAAQVDLLECAPSEIDAAIAAYRGTPRALALAIRGADGQTTGEADLRLIATARLRLPHVEHIVADAARLSPYVAQVALRFGADQLVAPGYPKKEIERLIREAGLQPFECDENYQPFCRAENELNVLNS